MQTSHDTNGQTVTTSVTGNTTGGSKLHGGDLTGAGHETMVSPVAGGAAVGALGGVSSTTSVMGAPGAASYGTQLGTTTQMLSGGDNYSGYQNMFTPDYLSFGMYGYYGNSQGLGDASAAAANATPNSLWSGTATGAASTAQNDMSLSYLNFHTPGGTHGSYDYGYYSFNAQNPYNTWGTPATAASASGLDYNDLSGAAAAAAWGPAIGAPPANSAGHTAAGQHDYAPGATNGSALLKETGSLHQQHQQQMGGSGSGLFSGSSVGYGSSQQQGAQQQANNSNIFVNGGLSNSNSAMLAPMQPHAAVSTGAGDFTATSSGVVPVSSGILGGAGAGVDRSVVTGAGVSTNDICGLEQTFSQFGLGHGHSPSGHSALTSGTTLSGLMTSPPGGHHVGQQQQAAGQVQQQQQGQSVVTGPMPVSSIRSDETHFPGLGASASVGVSVAASSQPSAVSSISNTMGGGGGGSSGGKKTWASIASQPAKGSAATLGVIPGPGGRKLPGVGASGGGLGPLGSGGSSKAPGRGTPTVLRPNMPWDSTGSPSTGGHGNSKSGGSSRGGRSGGGGGGSSVSAAGPVQSLNSGGASGSGTSPGVLFTNEELASKNFNPRTFDLNPKCAKFFVIKSYSEDDIHRSIKYQIWCSTEHGNKKLDAAFHEMDNRGPVYLFFSVNGSGHFCGVAQMASRVDYDTRAGVWCQDKWKGEFRVKWIYVKDVPNSQLRHIRLETNENKPVTNSRDATEVPLEKGRLVLKVIHTYKHTTSIFDDFSHYERREEQENQKRNNGAPSIGAGSNTFSH